MNTDSQWSKQEACFARAVLLLANEIGVRSILHGHVNLAAVNQIDIIHEAVNSCKNLKIL